MDAAVTAPYRAYRPQPFTVRERESVTLLFGGLHWRAERALQGILENSGYRAQILPPPTREDLLTGRELADIGQCCPTAFTTGNLVNFLSKASREKGVDAVVRDYVYVTAGSCGACRFGQYHQSYELALRNLGLDAFRMFLISQTDPDQGSATNDGLKLDASFSLGAAFAILCADVVQDAEYQIRPYELEPGATNRASQAAMADIYEALRTRPRHDGRWGALAWHLGTGYFARAMRHARRHFDAVEVDRLRVKPKIKITGEFYVQTVEGEPNHHIHSWLESEGAEVYPAAIAIWIDYLIREARQDLAERRGVVRHVGLKVAGLRLLSRLLRRTYNHLRAAFLNLPHEMPVQDELSRLAAPYFDARMSGGEGDMLIGKALWAHLERKAHMICELSPYACMPNTMSVGAMAAVLGKHPDLLYAPLEIKGDSEIHVLSRCQMILTEAKQRAQQEFAAALAAAGMTEAEARTQLAKRPDLRRTLRPLPRRGAAGTAANIVLELAGARL